MDSFVLRKAGTAMGASDKPIILAGGNHPIAVEWSDFRDSIFTADSSTANTYTALQTLSANTLEVEAAAGITGGTGTIYTSAVERVGGMIRTTIMLDLTGLDSVATQGDIIGTGTEAAHIGQITAARNGTILYGRVTCLEAPTTGDPDIDIYAADEATGALDADIASLTETQLVDAGDHTAGSSDVLTAVPAAGQYLYLVANAVTPAAGTYDAGKLLIELYGS